jgi:hypothetical protein
MFEKSKIMKKLIKVSIALMIVMLSVMPIVSADNTAEDCVGVPGPYGISVDGECPDTFLVNNEIVNISIMIFILGAVLLAISSLLKPESINRVLK